MGIKNNTNIKLINRGSLPQKEHVQSFVEKNLEDKKDDVIIKKLSNKLLYMINNGSQLIKGRSPNRNIEIIKTLTIDVNKELDNIKNNNMKLEDIDKIRAKRLFSDISLMMCLGLIVNKQTNQKVLTDLVESSMMNALYILIQKID